MLAFTVLLVACVVAGSSATKSHGVNLGHIQGGAATIQQVSLTPRMSMQQYRVANPTSYYPRGTQSRYLPAPKYSSHGSGINTYATNFYNNDLQGVLGAAFMSAPSTTGGSMGTYTIPTAYRASFSSPSVSRILQQGANIMPSAYQTSDTYNIGLGNAGTAYTGLGSSQYLLNQPSYSSQRGSVLRRTVPMSKKAGHAGSF